MVKKKPPFPTDRPKPPTPINTLVNRRWKLNSQWLRIMWRDVNGEIRCVTCGTRKAWNSGDLHVGHYYHGKQHHNSYFDFRNLAPQCKSCNTYGQGRPRQFALYLENRFGPGILQSLQEAYYDRRRYSREELELHIVELRKQIRALGETPCT